jgi:hypothetical protein
MALLHLLTMAHQMPVQSSRGIGEERAVIASTAHGAAGLEDQYPQPSFSELPCRDPAGGAGADDDGIPWFFSSENFHEHLLRREHPFADLQPT